jgi:hypothetical protein
MGETVAILVATVVIPTWVAVSLLALRDRYFPTAPRPEHYGPDYPPKWARQHPLVAKITLLAFAPFLLLPLVFVAIVVIPIYAWKVAAIGAQRVSKLRKAPSP